MGAGRLPAPRRTLRRGGQGGGRRNVHRGAPAGTYGIDYTTAAQYMQPLPDVTVAPGGVLATAIPATGVLTIFPR